MAQERGNPQVARTFRALGGFAQKKNDLWHALRALSQSRGVPDPHPDAEAGGQPDYIWLVPPYGGFLEVKDGETRFSFAQLSDRQRAWLSAWPAIAWLWLFMGRGRAGTTERAAYLVPWPEWLSIEAQAQADGLHGLAWRVPQRLAHRAAGLSIAHRCAPFALAWQGRGAWEIPPSHPFWTRPKEAGFLFDARRERKVHGTQNRPCDAQPLP